MFSQGSFVADRYEILDKVGAGGMSDVYRAKDHILDRVVAIKVLKAEYAEDMTFVNKFRTEAQSAAGLEHPNIVNIYDVGSEDGTYYIVMEYVEGITLKTYIEKKEHLNFKEAVSIAIQVGRGIEAAHAKNIIHRDIKPQNVMISVEGKVKVTDFGIAKATTSNTMHSDVMGSVHYSSPEQARNGFVDGRSDIYSLGIVMYEMVTGRVPFNGDNTVAIAIQHLQTEIVPPSAYATDLPVSLEKIILKCTQKIADNRYNNITELLTDLKKALVSPNEDFVVMNEPDLGKTKVLSAEEKEQLAAAITSGAAVASGSKAAVSEIKPVKFVDDDDDDDDDEDDEEEKKPVLFGRRKKKDVFDEVEDEEEEDEEEDDDDDEEADKTDKMFLIMGIVAAVIIVAIIVVLLGNIFGLFHFGTTSKDVMPNVVGTSVETVQSSLLTLGIKADNIKVQYKDCDASSGYTNNQIIEQSVEAGKNVSSKTTVLLTVAKVVETQPQQPVDQGTVTPEAKEVSVPNVVGYAEANAVSSLTDAGLKYNRAYENSATVASGNVISQSPAAGTSAKEGSTVVIVVSSGNVAVPVPNVTGLTQQEAIDQMNKSGLNVTSVNTKNSDSVAAGIVIDQSVVANKMVDAGTNITLTVSAGKSAKYYKMSEKVSNESDDNYIAYIYDANDKEMCKINVAAHKAQNINISAIATPTGKLKVVKEDGTEVETRELIFTEQTN